MEEHLKYPSETRLPEHLKPFFWDVSLDEVSIARSPHFVISPGAHGDHPEALWRILGQEAGHMLYDLQEERIYAYSYAEFSSVLNRRLRQSLKEQYEDALRRNQFVLFVRDNSTRMAVSFSMDNE